MSSGALLLCLTSGFYEVFLLATDNKATKKRKPFPTVTENQIARQFNDILSVPLRGKGKKGLGVSGTAVIKFKP